MNRVSPRVSAWTLTGLAAAAASALLLSACDPQRVAKLEEGVSTEVEVRKQFGDPVTTNTLPDGSKVLDYPRQPEGWTNYVIKIGPDGKMSSLRQLVSDDNFAKITPGMGQQQVRDILGRPAEQKRYDLKKEEVWSWRYKPVNESKLLTVTFGDDKKVVSTAKADDPREQAQAGR
jgi:outer membrane protein assembly factor BamE (lipoprotein component of BamABCDE complex)